MRPALLHTTDRDDRWRVFFALIVKERKRMLFDEERYVATLLYFDGGATLIEQDVEHMLSRVSASFWVHFVEHRELWNDIQKDHQKRGLSRQQLLDLMQILNQFGIQLTEGAQNAVNPTRSIH